ncbi:MAG: hypothetical protein LUP97_05410 [Methanoregula sp.]|nr:hypothetical protein [Methanoregula sp.]
MASGELLPLAGYPGPGSRPLGSPGRTYLVLREIGLLGKIDGIGAAGRIREKIDAPVLLLTANSDDRGINEVSHCGPEGSLLKPFGEEISSSPPEGAVNR